MIDIKVSDHCHDCENFEPSLNTCHSSTTYEPIHHIVCYHADECRHIRLHLEKKLKESAEAEKRHSEALAAIRGIDEGVMSND